MKKRILASLLTLALLLLGVPAVAADEADDYDRLAVEAGYHARVGSAEEAYADGEFTGYLVLDEDLDGNQRDHVLDDVPAGSTVTLITDVQMTYQLYLNSACTLDGNGYTLHGAIRSDSGTADMVVKNLTIVTPLGPQDGGETRTTTSTRSTPATSRCLKTSDLNSPASPSSAALWSTAET